MPIKEIEFGQRSAKMEFLVFRNLMKDLPELIFHDTNYM